MANNVGDPQKLDELKREAERLKREILVRLL